MAEIASAVLQSLNEVYKVVQQVKVNKKQCKTLGDRILSLEVPLRKLQDQTAFTEQKRRTLDRTLGVVKDAHVFMLNFTEKNWIRKAFNHQDDANTFHELNQRLQECIGDLHLDIAVDLFMFTEQDSRDQEDDLKDMEEVLEKLVGDVDELNQLVRAHEATAMQQQEDIMKALCSLRAAKKGHKPGRGERKEGEEVVAYTEITYGDLAFGDRIGGGSFGEVWQGTYLGTRVAIKKLINPGFRKSVMEELRAEVALHESLRFPYVVQLIGACTQRADRLCMVMELAPGGNCYSLLHGSDTPLDQRLKASMLWDIARGMRYIHSKGVLHRDLKSLNVLVFSGLHLKLCDFGLAYVKHESSSTSSQGAAAAGTVAWMAVELLTDDDDDDMNEEGEGGPKMGSNFTPQADVYSFGVVVYEFLSRKVPYKGKKAGNIISYVVQGKRLSLGEEVLGEACPGLVDIMTRSWAHRPQDRPSFTTIAMELEDIVQGLGGDPREAGEGLPPPPPATTNSTFASTTTSKPPASPEILTLLKGVDLLEYSAAVVGLGMCTLDDARYAMEEDLKGIGMTTIQARKLLDRAKTLSSSITTSTTTNQLSLSGSTATATIDHIPSSMMGVAPLTKEPSDLFKPRPTDGSLILTKAPPPPGRLFKPKQLEKIKNNRFDPNASTWVPREVPLSPEELDCWQEQAAWLTCPITGTHWTDKDAVMGVAIYHAPRSLPQCEVTRRRDYDEGRIKRTEDPWGWHTLEEFQVYPRVLAPPDSLRAHYQDDHDDGGGSSKGDLGQIDLMVGPTFHIDAFNDGVKGNAGKHVLPYSQRGVLSLDKQFNALVFQYYVQKADTSYIRKLCTSRLSFYIEPNHGAKVFPKNIRSQLSLLLYRSSQRLTKPNGSTDEVLLADAIRQAIPKILRAAVMEVYHGRSTKGNNVQCNDSYIDFAIRTYLLIHQVSIKLVVYHEETFSILYHQLMNYLQQPFKGNDKWADLEDVLITASLVGIPWRILREVFMRKFFLELMSRAPSQGVTIKARLKHLFNQNKALIHRFLYEFIFFSAGRSAAELDRIYDRCAGSLPRRDRDMMKESITEVQSVSSLEEVWVRVGMEVQDHVEEEEVVHHMGEYLSYLDRSKSSWEKGQYSGNDEGPPPVMVVPDVATLGAAGFSPEVQDRIRLEQQERAKHTGYPDLNKEGKLDKLVCNYPQCGKRFKCRQHLFNHLNRMIGKQRMIYSYHQSHFHLRHRVDEASIKLTSTTKPFTCPACSEIFTDKDLVLDHLQARGVFGKPTKHKLRSPRSTGKEQALSDGATPATTTTSTTNALQHHVILERYYDYNGCVKCGIADHARALVAIPCGHACACLECGSRTTICPLCDTQVVDYLRLYH